MYLISKNTNLSWFTTGSLNVAKRAGKRAFKANCGCFLFEVELGYIWKKISVLLLFYQNIFHKTFDILCGFCFLSNKVHKNIEQTEIICNW